jgi:hypothetical protein
MVSSPNGNPDNYPTLNQGDFTVEVAMTTAESNATFSITIDNYGSEISWDIKDGAGTLLAAGGPYADGAAGTQYTTNIPLLNNECYEITINDTYGDGILSPGGYSLTDAAGTIIIQEVAPSFGYQAIEVFSKSTTTLINEITQEKINDNKIYDLLGRELKKVPVGTIYIRNQKLIKQ